MRIPMIQSSLDGCGQRDYKLSTVTYSNFGLVDGSTGMHKLLCM